eukprot:TRINITY_DN24977_c0_g1_i1.p1 TRINITY_DN24977_c0_g1~~TRINITY_DN24977_c0_g1_i1.p1  ORF type:complete len:984 (+),score=185.48 TRINITY_DN24977_c0_g1_i1:191-3142(+)
MAMMMITKRDAASPEREHSFTRSPSFHQRLQARKNQTFNYKTDEDNSRLLSPQPPAQDGAQPTLELKRLLSAALDLLPSYPDVCREFLDSICQDACLGETPVDLPSARKIVRVLTSNTATRRSNHSQEDGETTLEDLQGPGAVKCLSAHSDYLERLEQEAPTPIGSPRVLAFSKSPILSEGLDHHSSSDSRQVNPSSPSQRTLLNGSNSSHSGLMRDDRERDKSCKRRCLSFLHNKLPWLPDDPELTCLQKLFLVCEDPETCRLAKIVQVIMMLTIVASTLAFCAESETTLRHVPDECDQRRAQGLPLTREACETVSHGAFFVIEAICIAIFTAEYVIRLLTVVTMPKAFSSRCPNLCMYAMQPMNVIDLLAIAPFYIDLLPTTSDMGFMRAFRLVRVLRLVKMAKHNKSMNMFMEVLHQSGQPLAILLFFNVIIGVIFAAAITTIEGSEFSVASTWTKSLDANGEEVPGAFPTGAWVRPTLDNLDMEISPFSTIPRSLWWVFVTTTTVGYGDFSPTTKMGKTVGVAVFYAGIVFLAMPIGVLCTNFETVYNETLAEELAIRAEKTRLAKMKKQAQNVRIKSRRRISMDATVTSVGPTKLIFLTLENPSQNKIAYAWSMMMLSAIMVSVVAFVLESLPDYQYTRAACTQAALTVEDCKPLPRPIFGTLEVCCITLFTIDYALRMSTVHSVTPDDCAVDREGGQVKPAKLTLLYALQPLNIVDFLAIAPFYIQWVTGVTGGGTGVLRVLRLIRVFRVLKMPRLKACVDMFLTIIREAMPALGILVFMTGFWSIIFAALIVFTENSTFRFELNGETYDYGVYVRPTADGSGEEASPFVSIPYAMWWFFTTATTVGYGDDYPTTTAGRFVGILTFYVGIVLLALPITIIGGSFSKYYPDFIDTCRQHKAEQDALKLANEAEVLEGQTEYSDNVTSMASSPRPVPPDLGSRPSEGQSKGCATQQANPSKEGALSLPGCPSQQTGGDS